MSIDLNRAHVSGSELNKEIEAILNASVSHEQPRPYLGASAIGSECARKVQYDWQVATTKEARTKRIFARGHAMEQVVADAFNSAGFRLERGTPACEFSALDGMFKGHCDGIFRAGPDVLQYPALWEHKALGSKGWKQLEKNGLAVAYPVYLAQCQLYMAYLELTEHPTLFTALNSDTCELLHILVPFDAEAAQAASDRAVRIVEATIAHELLPRVSDNADDWRCRFCGHKERCWA